MRGCDRLAGPARNVCPAIAGRERGPRLGSDPRSRLTRRRRPARQLTASLRRHDPRHGDRDRLRDRCGAGADPHQSPRRDHGPRSRRGRLPEQRGGRGSRRLPRSRPRFRDLPIRSVPGSLHEARGPRSRARACPRRDRDPRRRQRCRREALDPLGHHRAPGSRCARVRPDLLQRLQHVLHPGCLEHVGWLVGLARDRHRRPGHRAQRRRSSRRGLELLPAAGPGGACGRADSPGRGGFAGDGAGRVRPQGLRRGPAARATRAHRGGRARGISGRHRDDRRAGGRAGRAGGGRARGRRRRRSRSPSAICTPSRRPNTSSTRAGS